MKVRRDVVTSGGLTSQLNRRLMMRIVLGGALLLSMAATSIAAEYVTIGNSTTLYAAGLGSDGTFTRFERLLHGNGSGSLQWRHIKPHSDLPIAGVYDPTAQTFDVAGIGWTRDCGEASYRFTERNYYLDLGQPGDVACGRWDKETFEYPPRIETEVKVFPVGDASLDGVFDSSDLVFVFQSGAYDTGRVSGWRWGDFNIDGAFTSSDLVFAFQEGGYEQGPRANAVPEPTSLALLIVAVMGVVTLSRSRGKPN